MAAALHPPVPELLEELVEEILLRFPPDDPASLVRAALVCRLWRRLVSAAAFRRRFREFHRTAPLLGVLCPGKRDVGRRGGDGDVRPTARFVPTSSFRPAHPIRYGWCAVDARLGRVLLQLWPWGSEPLAIKLAVWEQHELPSLPMQYHVFPASWTAAVICAAGAECEHLDDCHWGSFMVVLVDIRRDSPRALKPCNRCNAVHYRLAGIRGKESGGDSRPLRSFQQKNIRRDKICSSFYSPEVGAWSEQTFSDPPNSYDHFKAEPGVLMGNALYFLFHMNPAIVKYDLITRKASTIGIPPQFHPQHVVLMTMDDGKRLGFAAVDKCKLNLTLWSRVDDGGFVQCRVINLPKVLNAPKSSPHVSGFAHGVGLLFIWTFDGLYSMDVKSEQIRKVPTKVPFSSLKIPKIFALQTVPHLTEHASQCKNFTTFTKILTI